MKRIKMLNGLPLIAGHRAAAIAILAMAFLACATGARADTPATAPSAAGNEMETRTGSFQVCWPFTSWAETSKRINFVYQRYGYEVPKYTQDQFMSWFSNTRSDIQPEAGHEHDPYFAVHVPPDYAPGKPFGLLVWMWPIDSGVIRKEWVSVVDSHHLIWIGPDNAGNKVGEKGGPRDTVNRMFLAYYALEQAKKHFTLDSQRIYVGGFSGGSRVASQVAQAGPDFFNGGIFCGGLNCYKNVQAGGMGMYYPSFWARPDSQLIAKEKANSRFAIVIGTEDKGNYDVTKEIHVTMKADGFQNLAYFEMAGVGHEPPSTELFAKVVDTLDAPLTAAADKTYKDAQMAEKGKRLGDACVGYGTAALHGSDHPWVADAQAKADALHHQYEDEVKKIEDLIADRQFDKAVTAARSLQSSWNAMGKDKSIELLHQVSAERVAGAKKPATHP